MEHTVMISLIDIFGNPNNLFVNPLNLSYGEKDSVYGADLVEVSDEETSNFTKILTSNGRGFLTTDWNISGGQDVVAAEIELTFSSDPSLDISMNQAPFRGAFTTYYAGTSGASNSNYIAFGKNGSSQLCLWNSASAGNSVSHTPVGGVILFSAGDVVRIKFDLLYKYFIIHNVTTNQIVRHGCNYTSVGWDDGTNPVKATISAIDAFATLTADIFTHPFSKCKTTVWRIGSFITEISV